MEVFAWFTGTAKWARSSWRGKLRENKGIVLQSGSAVDFFFFFHPIVTIRYTSAIGNFGPPRH